MLSSSPLAAETHPNATRSFDFSTVEPGATVTVTITAENYGRFGRVMETLPAELEYVDGSSSIDLSQGGTDLAQGILAFNLLGDSEVSYQVTSSTEGTHDISGTLRDSDQTEHPIGGDTSVTVSTDTGPAPVDAGDLQFDVVKTKAVKGAVVSGLKNPIGSNPLQWSKLRPVGRQSPLRVAVLVGEGDFLVEENLCGEAASSSSS